MLKIRETVVFAVRKEWVKFPLKSPTSRLSVGPEDTGTVLCVYFCEARTNFSIES